MVAMMPKPIKNPKQITWQVSVPDSFLYSSLIIQSLMVRWVLS